VVTKPHKRYVILATLSFDETGASALQEAVRLSACNPESDLHVVHVYGQDFEQTRHGELFSAEQQRLGATSMPISLCSGPIRAAELDDSCCGMLRKQ